MERTKSFHEPYCAKCVNLIENMFKNLRLRASIMQELLSFLWKEKMWWLIPIMVILLLLGILMVVAQSSPVAPFIYTLF